MRICALTLVSGCLKLRRSAPSPGTAMCSPVSYVVCLLLAAGLSSGCGSNNPLGRLALSGSVMLDGKPLDKGAIELHPLESTGVQSGGMISAGKYAIATSQGPTAGKYRVVIYDSYET